MSENGQTGSRCGATYDPVSNETDSPNAYYEALVARDARFDGVFFVGVKTTGVYCRPICPARTPGRDRCVFFAEPSLAEREGFRACFRCRPELAPKSGPADVDARSRLVAAAMARIDSGYLNDASVDALAAELGVTGRHLRRAMEAEVGVSPVELAQSRRLGLAKRLLQDTSLSLTAIAMASGFSSVRRYNALFQARFGRSPSSLRREHLTRNREAGQGSVTLRLDYRRPFDWEAMLAFLKVRATEGVEEVTGSEYRRTVRIANATGVVSVTNDDRRGALRARVSLSLASVLMPLVARLRAVFDLDAQPLAISAHLSKDPLLRKSVRARPGLRVPGAFEPFEIGVRAVVSQMITVRGATTVMARLAGAFGEAIAKDGALFRLFPTAEALARASVDQVAGLGMPAVRARALIALARATCDQGLLARDAPVEETMARLCDIPGIGPWTAHYVAMRGLGWPDAFVASDVALQKALGVASAHATETLAASWRPWRAYAVMHLWTSLREIEK
jgi:AraC family transcriptional regulator of adaptative response / DNA-3-methyladenine glycosylase II